MTDLSTDEREAIALGFLSMAKLLKPEVYYQSGFRLGREYSKQREEGLREALTSDKAFRAAEAVLTGLFGDPSPEEEHADTYGMVINAVIDALAENGDSDG